MKTDSMGRRERYRRAILFGEPDKIPLMPGQPRESTLRRWHEEGLPEDKHYYEELMEILGLPVETSNEEMIDPGVSFKMIPPFEEKLIEHKNGHSIVQDWTVRRR